MSHVYYFGSESSKPTGQIEIQDKEVNITRVLLSDDPVISQELKPQQQSQQQQHQNKQQQQQPQVNVIASKTKFVSVHAGREIVIIVDGEAWSFGAGSKGQLGLDTSIHKQTRAMNIHRVNGSIKERIKTVAVCLNHTLALTESNKIYAWGESTNGKLSELDVKYCLRPYMLSAKQFQLGEKDLEEMKTNSGLPERKSIVGKNQLRTNRSSMVQKGQLSQSSSQLKKGITDRDRNNQSNGKLLPLNLQLQVDSSSMQNSLQLSKVINMQEEVDDVTQNSSHQHLPKIKIDDRSEKTDDDTVHSLANNSSSLVVLPSIKQPARQRGSMLASLTQQQLQGKLNEQKYTTQTLLAVGFNQSLVFYNGNLFAFGKQENGILGVVDKNIVEFSRTPLLIKELSLPVKLNGIAAGQFHNLAWDENGALFSWGDGTQGQLGHPIENGYSFNRIESRPKRINLLKGKNIIQASCGKFYSTAITIEGELYGWGRGEFPRDEEITSSLMESIYPRKLMPEGTNAIHVKFIKVSSGATHNATIDQFGRLYTWGDCSEYCLGHSAKNSLRMPKMVGSLKSKLTIDVSCGDKFTIVIQEEQGKNTDSTSTKPLIVDQFKIRNVMNIRQKIKTIYDYSKLKASVVNDSDDRSPTLEGGKGNARRSIIAPLSTLQRSNSRIDSVSGSGSGSAAAAVAGGGGAADASMSISQMILEQSPRPLNNNFNKGKGTQKFELNLEAIQPLQRSGSKQNRNIDIALESKDSGRLVLSSINQILENKNHTESKTYKAVQDSSLLGNMRDLFKKMNRNIRDSQLQVVTTSQQSQVLAFVFDECSELLGQKEKYDPLFLPFQSDPVEVDDSSFNKGLEVTTEGGQIERGVVNGQESSGQVMVGILGDLLDSKNEQLKYEYIEMVRRGLEDDHLLYLLSEPVDNQLKKRVCAQRKKSISIKEQVVQPKMASKGNLTNSRSFAVQTKNDVEDQRRFMLELINQCKDAQHKARNIVGKFNKFTGQDPRQMKPNKRFNTSLLEALNSSELYAQMMEKKHTDLHNITVDRQLFAQQRREEIEYSKHQILVRRIEEKSPQYQQEQLRSRETVEREQLKKRLIIRQLAVEQVLSLFRNCVLAGLKQRQEMFVYNLKARIIQSKYKGYLVRKKMRKFNIVQVQLLRSCIQKWLKKRVARRITLHLLKNKLHQKIKTNLLRMRLNVINIQKFCHHFIGIQYQQITQLAIQFDNHIINTAKTVDLSFLKYFKRNEVHAGQSSGLALSPLKTQAFGQFDIAEAVNKKQIFAPENLRPQRQISQCIAKGTLSQLTMNRGSTPLSLLPHFDFNKNQIDLKEKIPLERNKKGKSEGSNNKTGNVIIVTFTEPQPQGTLLPFTQHREFIVLQLNYKISYESQGTHDLIIEKVEKAELQIKYVILRNYLHQIRNKYRDNLRLYNKQLMKFCQEYKHEVDLERTKLLLRTSPANLKLIEKKEEYEFKKMKKQQAIQQQQQLSNVQLVDGYTQHGYLVKDHLPFGTVILSIAAQMPKSPLKPRLKIKISQDTFKAQMDELYKEFKSSYQRAAFEQRMEAINASKAKKAAPGYNQVQGS